LFLRLNSESPKLDETSSDQQRKSQFDEDLKNVRQDHELSINQIREQLHAALSEKESLKRDFIECTHKLEALSVSLAKATKERDSTMQSLQTVYADRIEMKQAIDRMSSEKRRMVVKMDRLVEEKRAVITQLNFAHEDLASLRRSIDMSSVALPAAVLPVNGSDVILKSSVERAGVVDTDDLISCVIDEQVGAAILVDGHGAQSVVEKLVITRHVGDVMLDVEDDQTVLSSMFPLGTTLVFSADNVHDVHASLSRSVDVATQRGGDDKPAALLSDVEQSELVTLRLEYNLVCSELFRLRQMLVSLQGVDREREDLRVKFQEQIRQLRMELLTPAPPSVSPTRTASVTPPSVMGASPDSLSESLEEDLRLKEVEVMELKTQLESAAARMDALLTERESQRSNYEAELEEIRAEHLEALRRIDALVQEHNILLLDSTPLSTDVWNEKSFTERDLVGGSNVLMMDNTGFCEVGLKNC